jgi:hypothetical protein
MIAGSLKDISGMPTYFRRPDSGYIPTSVKIPANRALLIGMNPSSPGDPLYPKLEKQIDRAFCQLGISSFAIMNLFPEVGGRDDFNKRVARPCAKNESLILAEAGKVHLIIAAWGNIESTYPAVLMKLLGSKGFAVKCVAKTARGNPLHMARWLNQKGFALIDL